jgi:hypothetical protein
MCKKAIMDQKWLFISHKFVHFPMKLLVGDGGGLFYHLHPHTTILIVIVPIIQILPIILIIFIFLFMILMTFIPPL